MHRNSVKAEMIVDNVIVSQEVLEYNGFMVVPGQSEKFRVRLTPVAGVVGELWIDFDEISSIENSYGVKLKDCVRVRIAVEGKEVFDELLADLFEGDRYEQVIKLRERRSFYIDVEFYLPIEIGNEVKNTSVDFNIFITVQKQKIG
jgi:hypothetical protein